MIIEKYELLSVEKFKSFKLLLAIVKENVNDIDLYSNINETEGCSLKG